MSDSPVVRKNFDAIDLTKFILSFLIVALHADAFYDISPKLNLVLCGGIARIGVPVFFTASAFFFFRKKQDGASLKRYCKRLGILYLCWFIVQLPKTIFDRIICSHTGFAETMFRFVRSFFVTSTFSGSWFIVSCIFCALLFYALEKLPEKRRKVITLILSVAVYVFCVICSAYGNILEGTAFERPLIIYKLIFANPYNNLFTGIPYFALGRYFAKHEGNWGKKTVYIAGTVISVVLLVAEVLITNRFGLTDATDCYFLLFPCVFFLFPLILGSNLKLKNAAFLRVTSTVVFFSQFIWLFACEIAEWLFKITIPYMGKFLFAAVCGFLLSVVMQKIQKYPKFAWVRYFY